MNKLPPLDKKEALRYLGYHQQVIDENTQKLLEEAAEECVQAAKPKYIWQLFKIGDYMDLYRANMAPILKNTLDITGVFAGETRKQMVDDNTLNCSNFSPSSELTLPGKNIAQNLKDAAYCILFSATLGIDVDRLISISEHKSMTKALILDACASSYIETICDLCNQEVKDAFSHIGYKTAPRFSPGYGDLPIALQSKFCQVLDTHRKIGLSCSASNLLIPRKSVTAIIGLVPENSSIESKAPCEICQFQPHCQRRKESNEY